MATKQHEDNKPCLWCGKNPCRSLNKAMCFLEWRNRQDFAPPHARLAKLRKQNAAVRKAVNRGQ